MDNFRVADSTGDGVPELNMSAWRAGNFGRSKPFWVTENDMSIKNHLFVMKYSDSKFKSVWMSSNLPAPNLEFIFADLDNDSRQELIVIEGLYDIGSAEYGEYIAIWKWNSWGFTNEWRSEKGKFKNIAIAIMETNPIVNADCVMD